MKELLTLLEDNQIDVLKEILAQEQAEDIAEFLTLVPDDSLVDVFRLLPKKLALETFIEMEVENREILAENLFEEKYFLDLKPLLAEMEPIDLADFFQEIPKGQLPFVYRLLPRELAADTFVELDSDLQEVLIRAFSDKELQVMMDELFVDDAVDIIEEMPVNIVVRMLKHADKETRETINQILKYPKDSAGSIMTVEYVRFSKDFTVAQAFDKIRKTGIDSETVYTCYVTDDRRELLGVVSARTLMLSSMDTKICDIMETNIVSVEVDTDREVVANEFDKYDFLALPVVDKENRLVGIVTIDDAMDILQEEATEDISKMAAITPTDKPYLKTSVWRLCWNRLPWLLFLMISATFSGMLIEANEATLAFSITLTASIPMLMGTGGNAGGQASATIIRCLAIREVEFGDILRVLWKEFRVSILLGAILSVFCFVKLIIIDGVADQLGIALVISLAMFATVILSKIVGCSLPLLAKKLRLDPAVVANPFITTIVDVLSLVIYCNIAMALL